MQASDNRKKCQRQQLYYVNGCIERENKWSQKGEEDRKLISYLTWTGCCVKMVHVSYWLFFDLATDLSWIHEKCKHAVIFAFLWTNINLVLLVSFANLDIKVNISSFSYLKKCPSSNFPPFLSSTAVLCPLALWCLWHPHFPWYVTSQFDHLL